MEKKLGGTKEDNTSCRQVRHTEGVKERLEGIVGKIEARFLCCH